MPINVQRGRFAVAAGCALLVGTLGVIASRQTPAVAPVVAPTADIAPFLPNAALTPGAVIPADVKDVCVPGYSTRLRTAHTAEIDRLRGQVRALYHLTPEQTKGTEFDHLVSIEISGDPANIKNLWFQPGVGKWSFHLKDRLENELHKEVCDGKITLAQAQQEIATNWIAAYRKRFGEPKP